MNNITNLQKAFVNEYIKNGYNGTQAVLTIRPQLTYNAAKVYASDTLSSPNIKQLIQSHLDRDSIINSATRDKLIEKSLRIAQKAEDAEKFTPALQGIDLTAKLNRLYDRSQDDMQGYNALIQTLTVNISGKEQDKTIDITPDKQEGLGLFVW